MDGYEALAEAVRSIVLPGAPPRTSIEGAAIGLSFLDTVLRLNHVRRLTDRLTIVEHRSARRTTEVDIDLGMLDVNQRHAARGFQELMSQGSPGSGSTMWVPVARISRNSVAPVDVLDASGRKLPKLTQYETSRLLASALFHLLRGILAAHPDARRRETNLNKLLFGDHEARWLIQAALQTLLTDRSRPMKARTAGGTPSGARELALDVLIEHAASLTDYRSLLDIAVNEYLLVVALDVEVQEHLLTYDAPLRASGTKNSVLSLAKKLRANTRGYHASYESSLPASLRSYHLIVETEPGVNIERLYLATDADRLLVDELSDDLHALAGRAETAPQSTSSSRAKLTKLAAETTFLQVAELIRRKQWDAEQAALTNPGLDEFRQLSDTSPPDQLRAVAEALKDEEVAYDLALENDHESYRAHAYWRRHAGRTPGNASQITIRTGFLLRDTTASGPINVFWYAAGMALISLLMAALLTENLLPYRDKTFAGFEAIGNRGAVIAVLLLVPGFLYTRLAMPDRHSILGYLRALPRLVASLSVGSMATVAAAVAAEATGKTVAYLFMASQALLVFGALVVLAPVALNFYSPRLGRHSNGKKLWLIGAPNWVNGGRALSDRPWKAVVVYRSAGPNS